MDEDLLYTNVFVKDEQLEDVPSDKKKSFRKFYENKRKNQVRKKIVKDIDEDFEADSLMNTNMYEGTGNFGLGISNFIPKEFNRFDTLMSQGNPGPGQLGRQGTPFLRENTQRQSFNRKDTGFQNQKQIEPTEEFNNITQQGSRQREQVSLVHLSSADRDQVLYPNSNDMLLPLDREYTNIKKIRLTSLEFPNSQNVVRSPNNRVFWTTNVGIDGPIYETLIPEGNYTATELAERIAYEMSNSVQFSASEENAEDPKKFRVISKIDTNRNLVEFYMFNERAVTVDPFTKQSPVGDGDGSNLQLTDVSGFGTSNGIRIGDNILVSNSESFVGYTTTELNDIHPITGVISTVTLGVNDAIDFDEGGGPLVATVIAATYGDIHQIYSEVARAMTAAGTQTYTAVQNAYGSIRISAASNFDLLWNTGANAGTNIASMIGFDGSSDSLSKTVHSGTLGFLPTTSVSFKVNRRASSRLLSALPISGGGSDVIIGYPIAFKFLFNESNTTIADILGFPIENTSAPMAPFSVKRISSLIRTNLLGISGITRITTQSDHEYQVGDSIIIQGDLFIVPNFPNKILTVSNIVDSDTFDVEHTSTEAGIGASTITNVTSGNFTTNTTAISSITTGNPTILEVIGHNLVTGNKIKVQNIKTLPTITSNSTNGEFTITVIDPNNISVPFETISLVSNNNGLIGSNILQVNHREHFLSTGNEVIFYRSTNVGGIVKEDINGISRTITVVDSNTYTVTTKTFPTFTETGGGNKIRISTQFARIAANDFQPLTNYGYYSKIDNTIDDGFTVNQKFETRGKKFLFLTSQALSNQDNIKDPSNNVKNIFSKILLTQEPNGCIFNDFVFSDKIFIEQLLAKLSNIDLQLIRQDGLLYDLEGLDFSMTIEITEVKNLVRITTFNSRTGQIDSNVTI